MKVMTVLGTRPEIIRLSIIISKLDKICDHVLVHTGQNYDANLNDIFFNQLNIRPPDHFLNARGSIGEQTGIIFSQIESLLITEKPDKFLILGDTNSALSSFIAKRMGIPIYHMEAGNRCYDDRVPEEVNRRVIDHSSDILLPYTERSRQNLIQEGIPGQRIYVTGNPIYEVIQCYEPKIMQSHILAELNLQPQHYFLVTIHRAENVDVEERLRLLTQGFEQIQKQYNLPVVISTHPHTRERMLSYGINITNDNLRFLQPFGFFDFITLERNAFCLLSDSGTVQEECAIFGVPNVTIRDVTERPETIEAGSNILCGADPVYLQQCISLVTSQVSKWTPPMEYMVPNVSDIVIRILTGYRYK